MSEVKRYFIHTTDLRNINDDWFHNVEMSSKNLWDSGQVVELVHKEDYEKLNTRLDKLRYALNKINNLAVTAKIKSDENEWIRYIGLQAPQIARIALKEDEELI